MKKVLLLSMIIFSLAAVLVISLAMGEKKAEKPKPHYELDLSSTSFKVESGKDGSLVITIKATDGYKVNKDYPLKTVITETDGLSFRKIKFNKSDIKDISKPVINAPFKALKPGKYDVKVDLSFSVCTDEICEIRKPSITVPIEVTAGAEPNKA